MGRFATTESVVADLSLRAAQTGSVVGRFFTARVCDELPLDSHAFFGFHVALRPRRRDDLLGTGTEWEGDRVIGSTAETARKRPERP